jgi:hypothetical protein
MWSVAPVSVMVFGLLGLVVIAYATTRIALLERKTRRPALPEPSPQPVLRSTV